jgi:hypothetical protein
MTKVHRIGIICEDKEDFLSFRKIIKNVVGNDRLDYKRKSDQGCGKLRRKCLAWSEELLRIKCDLLIIVHDLDNLDYDDLHQELERILNASTFNNRYICIPVQEIEGWLLSDPENLEHAMKLDRTPVIKGDVEAIASPKEFLGRIIDKYSDGKVTYIHTVHNEKIADNLSIEKAEKKSPSFKLFADFLRTQQYQ